MYPLGGSTAFTLLPFPVHVQAQQGALQYVFRYGCTQKDLMALLTAFCCLFQHVETPQAEWQQSSPELQQFRAIAFEMEGKTNDHMSRSALHYCSGAVVMLNAYAAECSQITEA